MLLNNLTGMTSGYLNNKVGQPLVSYRDEKGGAAVTIFAPQISHPSGGDPYMSFIDSEKFSPIQSVSGED